MGHRLGQHAWATCCLCWLCAAVLMAITEILPIARESWHQYVGELWVVPLIVWVYSIGPAAACLSSHLLGRRNFSPKYVICGSILGLLLGSLANLIATLTPMADIVGFLQIIPGHTLWGFLVYGSTWPVFLLRPGPDSERTKE